MSAQRSRAADLVLTVSLPLLYALAFFAGRFTVVHGTELAVLAPAAGIAAVWFAHACRAVPRVLASAWILAATTLIADATGATSLDALRLGAASVVQVWVFTWLIERRTPDRGPLVAGDLDVHQLWRLAGRALAAAICSALLVPGVLDLSADREPYVAVAWILRNAVTIVGLYPLGLWLLSLQRGRPADPSPRVTRDEPERTSRAGEGVALAAVTAAGVWFVFGTDIHLPLAFALLATSVWAGSRFSPVAANVHAVLTGVTVAVLTTTGEVGHFTQVEDPVVRAAILQAFVATTLATSMALALHRRTAARLNERLAASEKAAIAQTRLLETILAATTEGVIVRGADGFTRILNPAAELLVGNDASTPEQVGLRDVRGRVIEGDDLPCLRALRGEQVVEEDYLIDNPDLPEPRVIQLSAARLHVADEEPLVVEVFHDVTAVRRERDELAAFAGVVAHDLLNPLTAVDGWSDALEEELSEPVVDAAMSLSHLTRIRRGADRMHALIQDLLAYTTARNSTITPVPVDLDSLVSDIVQARRDAASSSGVVPVITVEQPLPPVRAEPVLVRQVLDNLVGNALKYVAPGVTPQVLVRAERAGPDMVEIEVADNGIGIPPEQRSAVFETFHRAHTEGYKGTGLGLSIVKRVVERHGGRVTATQNPRHHGTSIRLTLPAVQPAD